MLGGYETHSYGGQYCSCIRELQNSCAIVNMRFVLNLSLKSQQEAMTRKSYRMSWSTTAKKAKYTVTFYHSIWTSRLRIITSSISAYPHIRSGSPPRSISKLYIFINFIGYLSAKTSQLFCIAALHSHVRRTGLP